MIPGGQGDGLPGLLEDLLHPPMLGQAGHVDHVPEMDHRLVRVVLDGPFQEPPTEKRLFGRALGHFYIRIHRPVALEQRKASGLVLLRVPHENDGKGERDISPEAVVGNADLLVMACTPGDRQSEKSGRQQGYHEG